MNIIRKVTRFGICSKSRNIDLINKFKTYAHKLGWIQQDPGAYETCCYYFTIEKGRALRPNHYWTNATDAWVKTKNNYINLDTDYELALKYLEIIGKRLNRYNKNIKKFKHD